jgi:hypothetical protein
VALIGISRDLHTLGDVKFSFRAMEESRMNRYQILVALSALSVAVSVGDAVADGPGAEHAEVKVGRVGFMDRALNLVQLEDGTELRTTDARLLRNITEGELVKVDFTYDGDKNVLNSIEPTAPDTPLGAIPDAVGSGITSH